MAATHRYLLADPVTDQPLGFLPLGGVSYSRRIAVSGDFEGSFPIANTRLGAIARRLVDQPLALYCYRTAGTRTEVWWGGLTWTAYATAGVRGNAPRCEIRAAAFESYPTRRRLWTTAEYDEVDRAAVIADLWTRLQTGTNASVGVEAGSPILGGEPWTGGWDPASNTTWAEAMRQVTEHADPALEWTIDVWEAEGVRHRKLRVGTPLLGRPDARPHLLARPGTMVSWDQPSDTTRRATHALARGVTPDSGDDIPTSPVLVDAAALEAGVLRVDGSTDIDTDEEAALTAAASGLLRPAATIPPITVRLPAEHDWNPGLLGDPGRVIATSPYFDGGRLDQTARVIGVRVQPAERGRDEQVTFEFQQPETGIGS